MNCELVPSVFIKVIEDNVNRISVLRYATVLRNATGATSYLDLYLYEWAAMLTKRILSSHIVISTQQRTIVSVMWGAGGAGCVRCQPAINGVGIVLWHSRLPSWRFISTWKRVLPPLVSPYTSRDCHAQATSHLLYPVEEKLKSL